MFTNAEARVNRRALQCQVQLGVTTAVLFFFISPRCYLDANTVSGYR